MKKNTSYTKYTNIFVSDILYSPDYMKILSIVIIEINNADQTTFGYECLAGQKNSNDDWFIYSPLGNTPIGSGYSNQTNAINGCRYFLKNEYFSEESDKNIWEMSSVYPDLNDPEIVDALIKRKEILPEQINILLKKAYDTT